MKPKACLACLLVLFILLTAITACARQAVDEETQPITDTSPTTRRTLATTKETEPSPGETEESDPSESAEIDPSTEASSAKTTTSSSASRMTLPSYTVTVTIPTVTTTSTTKATTTIKNLSKEYEAIYKDYAARLRNKTPVLIKEYKSEAKAYTSGSIGLGILQTQKVAALTRIEAEGTAEMTFLRVSTNGDAPDPHFTKWVEELGNVYGVELAKLRAAFK